MSGWKVRLGDGSEIGPMDLDALRTWLAQGLVDGDSPVMRPGSRKWVPLGTIQELKGALGLTRPKASSRPARARPERAAPASLPAASPEAVDHWRVRVVGILLLAAAAVLGILAWRPAEAPPAFDGAPWWQLALGALALGIALLPGWDLARRGVRLALLLVAFALFPLAGILIAQGERGAGLLALASAWLFVSGLAALLPSDRGLGRRGPGPRAGPRRRLRGVALRPRARDGRRAPRAGLGVTRPPVHRRCPRPHPRRAGGLGGPEAGQPARGRPPEARLTLAQPRQGGFGFLVTEPAPRGVATAEQYLDHVIAARRADRPGYEAGPKANALVGAITGRRGRRRLARRRGAPARARRARASTAGWGSPSSPGCPRRPPPGPTASTRSPAASPPGACWPSASSRRSRRRSPASRTSPLRSPSS